MMGIKAIAFWSIRRWRSDARFSLAALRGMAPFSLRLLATDLIASVYNNVAQLFIGKMHTTTALGYFSQAQKLKDLPVTSTMQAVQGVTYPALSKLADDDVRFTEGYRRILMLTAYLIFPVMAGLIAIAPDMFMLLLGDKWMPTVPYFEILALAGLVYPLSVVSYNILKVRSDGRVILRMEVIKRIIMTLILLYTIPRGVEAVAWGTSAMALIDFVINAAAAMRYTTLTAVALLRTLAMPLLLSALLYLGVVYLNSHLFSFALPLRLCLSITAGVAIYVVGSLIFRPEAFGEATKLVQSFRNK
jgi:O-antigen/teichoic acid export membrane protein